MKKHTKWFAVPVAALCILGMVACRSATATTGGTTPAASVDGTTIAATVAETTVGQTEEHTHSFGEWTVKTVPSCTEKGVRERVCACGERETEEIAALGHGETALREAYPASCTENGYSGDSYCSVCGEKLESGKVIAATGHSFGEWTVKTAATCTEKGIRERVCACGERETEEIAALGHGETALRDAYPASCTENGYSGDSYCSVCGEKLENGKVIAATGHSFGEWTVKTAASATQNGLEERRCGVCGYEETRSIPASGVTLSIEIRWEEGTLIAELIMHGGVGVTNGKVTVVYDAELLSAESVEMCLPCRLYDVNTQTPGTLSVTWVGSAAEETQTLLRLHLTAADGAESASIRAQADEIYAAEKAISATPVTVQLDLKAYTQKKSSYEQGGKAQ